MQLDNLLESRIFLENKKVINDRLKEEAYEYIKRFK